MRKARQSRGARFVHAMKRGGETALGGDQIGPAFEHLRGQTGGHGSRLTREGAARRESAGGIMAGDDFDRADGLRARRLRDVERILRAGGARLDLREVEVAREALLFAHVGELQSTPGRARAFPARSLPVARLRWWRNKRAPRRRRATAGRIRSRLRARRFRPARRPFSSARGPTRQLPTPRRCRGHRPSAARMNPRCVSLAAAAAVIDSRDAAEARRIDAATEVATQAPVPAGCRGLSSRCADRATPRRRAPRAREASTRAAAACRSGFRVDGVLDEPR